MSVDTATRSLLEELARVAGGSVDAPTPPAARLALSDLATRFGPGPASCRVIDVRIPVDGALLTARILVPEVQLCRALLVYFHGGGWVAGSIDEFEPMCRSLAFAGECALAIVDYRRAPEYPYPIPVNDAWEALSWIGRRLEQWVGRQVPLLVGGDSAGANLAIALTFRARVQNHPIIHGQVLIYPVTDYALDRPSYLEPSNQLLLTREKMAWYWSLYVPDPTRRAEPEASPLRRSDFSNLPAAIVVTAEHDVLRDEGEAYARRLREAGVDVRHKRFVGQMHGFAMMVDVLPGSASAIDYIGNELRTLLYHQSPMCEERK